MELLRKKKYTRPLLITFIFFLYYKPVVCFIIVGALILIVTFYYWNFLSGIRRNGIRGVGKIMYESSSRGPKAPTIEFTSKNGIKVCKKPYYYLPADLSKISTYKQNIGKEVDIFYDRQNPEKFVLEKEGSFNILGLLLIVLVGLTFLIVGICSVLGIVISNF